jgi:hypothetical protein
MIGPASHPHGKVPHGNGANTFQTFSAAAHAAATAMPIDLDNPFVIASLLFSFFKGFVTLFIIPYTKIIVKIIKIL